MNYLIVDLVTGECYRHPELTDEIKALNESKKILIIDLETQRVANLYCTKCIKIEKYEKV